jgi:hypothetical protein
LQSLHAQSLIQIKNVFACSKHSNLKSGHFFFFSNVIFSTKCAPFFIKFEKNLTLMIRRTKGLELMKIVFKTYFSIFGSNVFLTLTIMDFDNVALTKVIHMYLIECMNA